MRFLLFIILFLTSAAQVMAEQQNLPLPRFASLRKEIVYMRAGPGERFPIEWEYQKKDFPVQIIDSFEHWRKIEDIDKTQGWIHKKMLSDKRTALTSKNERTPLYRKSNAQSKILAYFDGQTIVKLLECEPTENFCQVKYNDLKGYIAKNALYGVYPDEEINE